MLSKYRGQDAMYLLAWAFDWVLEFGLVLEHVVYLLVGDAARQRMRAGVEGRCAGARDGKAVVV